MNDQIKESIERWRVIKGHEDYEVSDLGNIRSFKWGKYRSIKPITNQTGCRHFIISEYPLRFSVNVRQCVMDAFVGPAPEHHYIMHLNGDKSDDRLVNMVYATITDIRIRNNTNDKTERAKDYNPVCSVRRSDMIFNKQEK